MRAIDALRKMLDDSGTRPYTASKKMGKSDTYIKTTLKNSTLSADKLAAIARACGYRLVLKPKGGGDEIEVDGIVITDGYERIG